MGTAVHAHVPEIHARMVTMKRNAVGAGKGKKTTFRRTGSVRRKVGDGWSAGNRGP